MSDDTPTPATDRVRALEESVAGARATLERTEAALRAAETVARGADSARAHPARVIAGILVTLGITALIAYLVKDRAE